MKRGILLTSHNHSSQGSLRRLRDSATRTLDKKSRKCSDLIRISKAMVKKETFRFIIYLLIMLCQAHGNSQKLIKSSLSLVLFCSFFQFRFILRKNRKTCHITENSQVSFNLFTTNARNIKTLKVIFFFKKKSTKLIQ